MECSEVSLFLSEYVDDRLDPPTRGLVEAHLATCRECAAELSSLQAYLGAMAGMEKVAAPQDFLARVHERLERPSVFDRLVKAAFYPLRIKLPMELAGIALAALLLVFAYHAPQGEKPISHPSISIDTPSAPSADGKGAVLEQTAVGRPTSEPKRIELALLLNPPKMSERSTKLKPLAAPSLPAGKMLQDRQEQHDQSPPPPMPSLESSRTAASAAAKKHESSLPLDPNQAYDLIAESVASLGGTVLSAEKSTATNEPKTIVVQLPARAYSLLLTRLNRVGHLEATGDKPVGTMQAPPENGLLEIRIKLLQPE